MEQKLNKDQTELKAITSLALTATINNSPHDRNTVIQILNAENRLLEQLKTEEEQEEDENKKLKKA